LNGAPPSPFDAGVEGLADALTQAGWAGRVSRGDAEKVVVWMPTASDGRPIASRPLIAQPPDSSTNISLAAWSVTAVRLSTEQAVERLGGCVEAASLKDVLAPGVLVGSSLAFWATALRFAGALVARQQFLPDVQETADGYRARWQPVCVGADAERWTKLAQSMPHACRALTAEAAAPPTTPAASVLSDFLGEICDYLVRFSTAPSARPQKKAAFDSVHDQWLYALRSSDGLMDGDAAELSQLAAQVRQWRRPIAVSTAAPFRLCFRLEEPVEDHEGDTPDARRKTQDAPWSVRYLLQAADDPSLLVPVHDVWTAKGRKASLFKRGAFDAREYLLSSLGNAANLCPRIEDSLKTAVPSGYDLDATGAYDFLTEKAWLLEQAGFGVFLPAWWTRKGTKLRLSARAQVKAPPMQGGSGLTLESIVEFDWQIALGDQTLTRQELEALARLKAPLVKVRGQWVQLNADEIRAAMDFWKKKADGHATVREVVQMSLGSAQAPGGIRFEGVTATGWMADFLSQLQGHTPFEETPVPPHFRGTLRPYQVRGYSWLGFLRRWGLGACLADDMGLGKTIQTLALIQRDYHANGKRPTLLICPTSVVGNWQKEAARFTPDLAVMIHHGVTRAKGAAFQQQAERHAIVVSSYALLQRDFEHLKPVNWAGVILDEAQNVKNPETKQSKAARVLGADYRIALTGTPVENNVGDLWAIMEFLNPEFLGTQTEFKRTFFVPIQAYRDVEATERLKRLTGPFLLRRLKTDPSIIADLPQKNEMKVFCTLTREQASLYAAVVKDMTGELESADRRGGGIQRRGLVLATLMKLKQVCNHPAQFLGDNSPLPGRSGKLARLTEMLEEALSEGDKALIFSQFFEMGDLLRQHLQETFGREALFLHGGVPKKQRDRLVERFQSEEEARLFILSLKAGGTGLNLTAANHVFHFDRWWNPAVENQATDRAFRIGQTRNVQVHKFLCAGTLEEKIDDMIERKLEIAANVIGSGEGWLTELSTAELKELFALRQEAVGE
jgi:SNF2 family DNA or RNA helicase